MIFGLPELLLYGWELYLQMSKDSKRVCPLNVTAGTRPRGLTLLYHLGLLDRSTCTTSNSRGA